MSWEARADVQFAAAMENIEDQSGCIQLKQDDRSSIMEQDFPPLQKHQLSSGTSHPLSPDCRPFIPSKISSSHSIEASQSSSASISSGSEYVPSPLKTRAQRKQASSIALPLHKQKKMSKSAKREANALSRLSKPSTPIINHDRDEYQWNLLFADQQKRQKEEAAAKQNCNEDHTHSDATKQSDSH